MRRRFVPIIVSVLLIGSVTAWGGPVAATGLYSIQDLGVLAGDAQSEAYGINAAGQVAGLSATNGVQGCDYYIQHCAYNAFRYDSGGMTSLGYLPGGSASYGININDAGQVVGFGESGTSLEQAFVYSGGTMSSLGTLPGGSRSIAYGINNDGTIVGWSDITSGPRRAFSYSGNTMSDIGALPGDGQAQAYGINNLGAIVGWSYPETSSVGDCQIYSGACDYHAFVYRNGTMNALGNFPGGNQSLALNINDAGQIVGYGTTDTSALHGFLYENGTMTDVGTLGGATSVAIDVNAAGDVAGYSTTGDGDAHAFVYRSGVMTDLNTLLPANSGWSLTYAFGINDAGQIVGSGLHDGAYRAFLLTPSSPLAQLTALSPATIWIGLKNSDDVGIKFDLRAEVYKDNTLVSSGTLNSFSGGSSGFNNAHLATISFDSFAPVDFPPGSQLSIKLFVRNACSGSGHNSGTARLWYNDTQANSHFGATLGSSTDDYFMRSASLLTDTAGSGPKTVVDVTAGAKCSAFKPFGAWSITP